MKLQELIEILKEDYLEEMLEYGISSFEELKQEYSNNSIYGSLTNDIEEIIDEFDISYEYDDEMNGDFYQFDEGKFNIYEIESLLENLLEKEVKNNL